MSSIRTLWGLLRRPTPQVEPKLIRRRPSQDRYDALVDEMKRVWGIRVHRWRNSTSGCAWELRDKAGNVTRMIESPYPRGPMSCAVFMHEVGHHATGFGMRRLRCEEEHLAWDWSLREMAARGFNVTDRVRKRRDDAMRYALAKALRRGLKRVPSELVQWLPEGIEVGPQV
jgi:hypothetical protein